MDARHTNLLKFVHDARQFVIPIYQRKYSWTAAQCEQLWRDISRAGNASGASGHFIGSIVYVADSDAHNAPLLVIDGQQRLTTLTLLIAALSEVIEDGIEVVDGFSRLKLRGHYLTNLLEVGSRSRKLVLSEEDRETLYSIVDKSDFPEDASRRLIENFQFFRSKLAEPHLELTTICTGLSKLLVVYVALSRKEDNPQLIFESMNSTGRKLSQADLIRNFVLMGLEPDLQTRLYKSYWQPMEKSFGQEAYDAQFDAFMRHYLTVKTGEIPRLDDVYTAFKDFARTPEIEAIGVEELVKDVREYSRYYVAMALGGEKDPELRNCFHDLRELKVEVAYPFLLELYHDYSVKTLEHGEFLQAIRLIEAYVFRRAICSIPPNSLNKTFSTFSKSLRKTSYLESIQVHFQTMPSYRRFPDDVEFHREIQRRDLYNFRSRSYWLRRIENYGRKERAEITDYTIEHIMPQSDPLPLAWQREIGDNWQRVHEASLHTLGNLTLTGYNSEYSNRPFCEKRDMLGGFRSSPLRLNEGMGQLANWTQHEISERANRLALTAIDVWSAPKLPDEVIESYNKSSARQNKYTIDDHLHLRSGVVRDIFNKFSAAVTALDPCVVYEMLKLYIAFKAETNFVDVIPQANGLLLSIKLPLAEANDPRALCVDVTGKGRWGNGDIEFRLNSEQDIPYAVGLVRQALEQQLGNGD